MEAVMSATHSARSNRLIAATGHHSLRSSHMTASRIYAENADDGCAQLFADLEDRELKYTLRRVPLIMQGENER